MVSRHRFERLWRAGAAVSERPLTASAARRVERRSTMTIRNDDQQTLCVALARERRTRGMPVAPVPNEPEPVSHEVMPSVAAA